MNLANCTPITLVAHMLIQIIRRVRQTLDYLKKLSPTTREQVVLSYLDGLQVAFWFIAAVAMLAFITSFFMKNKPITQ